MDATPENQRHNPESSRGNEKNLERVLIASAAFPATFLLSHLTSPDSPGKFSP
jgi:hypothetical protein